MDCCFAQLHQGLFADFMLRKLSNKKQKTIISLEPGKHWAATLAFRVNKNDKKVYLEIPIQEFEGDNADTKKRILVIDSSQ